MFSAFCELGTKHEGLVPEGHLEVIKGFSPFSGKMRSEEKEDRNLLFRMWIREPELERVAIAWQVP